MTRTFRTRAAAALLAGALLAGACSGDDSGDDGGPATSGDTTTILATLADDVIVPRYQDLTDELGALLGAVEALCTAPSPDALGAARTSWLATQLAWGRTRAGMVGPATDLRLMGDVGYRARPDDIEELAASAAPVDPPTLDGQGTAVRGIFAVEQLLFAPASDALTSAAGAHRCAYASSAVELSLDAATAVLEAWTGDDGYRATLVEGPDGDPQMSVSTLVNDVTFRLQEIDDLGLRDLVGAASVDDLTEARRDGAGAARVAYLRAILDGATDVLMGPDGVNGLAALLEARSPDTAVRLVDLVEDANAALRELPDSVAAALADQAAVTAAADAVAALKVLVTTEVASQLGVTIGFSDADGDS